MFLDSAFHLSTELFPAAFERMVNRRGRCALLVSDNALTFKSGANLLRRIFLEARSRERITRRLAVLGIEWRFNSAKAPWQGGFFERIVRSVKTPLKKILGRSRLKIWELYTVLTDIEAQLNSRPLTEVFSNMNDEQTLTPGMLTIGLSPQTVPDLPAAMKTTALTKRWAYRQSLAKQFWSRWTKEYLSQLNLLKKWQDVQKNVAIGDVILIADENPRKQEWPLGRVEKILPGRDGLVRNVIVKTVKGKLSRPVQRLRLLEAMEEHIGES
ncbi:uncharacterized protein LOC141904304 [Tubulanus polymorphus]|uniref:uncharacterized protein LOC141904304 n=1 Tax=Tubulanus polymorphus TaxID=672921 RepID=UPI003DA58644